MTMESIARNHFGAVDYVFFIGLLAISALAGSYHFLRGKRPKTVREYILQNKARNPIHVACSVLVTVFSSVTYMGVPAEAYIHGPTFWLMVLHKPLLALIAAQLFLPVFYRLKIINIYDYLELRFNVAASYCGRFCNFVFILLNCSVLIYGPAIALSAVTGAKTSNAIAAVGIVCTLYTLLGGIRAVFWADLFQIIIMLIGFLITLGVGTREVGGRAEVIKIARDNERGRFFDFSPDPTLRTSFWSCTIGGLFVWLAMIGTNQNIMQRFLICRTETEAKIAVWIGSLCIGVVEVIATYTGIVMFAYYENCDPYTNGKVETPDQLIPYFMVNLFKTSPGISGILVYAAFSASLTFVTTAINNVTKDSIKSLQRLRGKRFSERLYGFLVLTISILFCGVSLSCAYWLKKCDSLIEIGISITGVLNGPILGLFSLGLFVPWANSFGAVVGALMGLSVGFWIKLGNVFLIPVDPGGPLSTEACSNQTSMTLGPSYNMPNSTIAMSEQGDYVEFSTLYTSAGEPSNSLTSFTEFDYERALLSLYSISYLYYCVIGWLVTVATGWVISMLSGPRKSTDTDPRLTISVFDSCCCCCMSRGMRDRLRCGRMKIRKHGEMSYTKIKRIDSCTSDRGSFVQEKKTETVV